MTAKPYVTLPSLTTGRGIAALFVAIHHSTANWPCLFSPIGKVGWLGVSFFYILSGFVLTWSYSKHDLKKFYIHRVARVYPLHIICLAASLIAFSVSGNPLAGLKGTCFGTIANLFLVHDWIPGHPNIRQAWNGVSWSLSVEVFMYIWAPLLITKALKSSSCRLLKVGLALYLVHLTIGAIAFHFSYTNISDFMLFSPIARLPEFIYGIIGACIVKRGFDFKFSIYYKYILYIPLTIYFINNINKLNNYVFMIDLVVPSFLLIIISGASEDVRIQEISQWNRFFKPIGEASYSLYMTHAIFLGLLVYCFNKMNFKLPNTLWTNSFTVTAYLILSVFLSIAVYRLIELPLRKAIIKAFLKS